ncbi:MAG: TonB-dependent receptor, partial [Gemmatimonadota bacterium]
MRARLALGGVCLGLLSAGAAPIRAQTGTIAGQVIDTEANTPLPDASVQIFQTGGQETAGALSGEGGRFTFDVAPGIYSVVVTLLGYAPWRTDGVQVEAGGAADVTAPLVPRAIELDPKVVTVGRQEEKALEAPATVSVVTADEIEERAAPTVVEHVKALPGVDAAQTGLQQANMVTRGFNNAFSGAMLVISDNRYARVPSLNVNVYSFMPVTNLDIERVEVVLGPGAALYGPNAASGVLHIITSSPIDDPGTKFNIGGGERSVFHGEFRHATRFSDKVGLKVSGQYFRGDDWTFTDLFEAAAREEALETDPDTRIGERNFESTRFGGSLRFDVRPWENGEFIVDAGFNQATQIELTGAGTAQAEDWTYSFAQARIRKGRFFAQGFGNFSDAGDSFLLRTGQSVVDNSFFVAGQVQHGFALGDDREDVIYGLDLQRTEPRTDGTITGRNEDDDTIDEIGGYVHSTTRLTETLDFIGALRLDHHNRLEDPILSPRAALVLEPTPTQNL